MNPPDTIRLMYERFLEEDLDHIENLNQEIEYFLKIYNKRVFQKKWPNHIKEIVDSLKLELNKTLIQAKGNLKSIQERINNVEDHIAQLRINEENIRRAREISSNTIDNITKFK